MGINAINKEVILQSDPELIGWREWVSLSELGIEKIKAKIDTGAKTSALHAFELKPFTEQGKNKIRFSIHPLQRNTQKVIICTADIVDSRWVSDSGGHREERFVIKTPITLGNQTWPIEITLTNRDSMMFRMLLGRNALTQYLIQPAYSYLIGKKK